VTFSPEAASKFRYALGVRYPAEGLLRGGAEFKQAPGWSAVLFPQIWFALPREITFKAELASVLRRRMILSSAGQFWNPSF